MYTIGKVVYSKRGRDKGRPFIIISFEGEYVYLVDGQLHKLEKPKKKKIKHVQATNDVLASTYRLDAEVRTALLPYSK